MHKRIHSLLGYLTPIEFEQQCVSYRKSDYHSTQVDPESTEVSPMHRSLQTKLSAKQTGSRACIQLEILMGKSKRINQMD